MSPGTTTKPSPRALLALLAGFAWCSILSSSCGQPGSPFGSDIPIIGLNDKGVVNPNNRPPVLKHIGDRTVAIGETLTIIVDGFDPDSDPLTFSVFGNLPEGAKFEKNDGRFDWTPTAIQAPVFLTFQVSDGFETDRETVKITTTTEKQNLPPVFQKVDDQIVIAGTNYSFQLQAVDPNGDDLLYGAQGSLPQGSQLIPESGLFLWNVPSHLVGSTILVVFTVTDGKASANMEVHFVVSLDGSGPAPPVFDPIGSLEVEAGKTLSYQVVASDPNNETIVFNLQGAPPPGMTLHPTSGIITWTPPLTDAGKTFTITIVASDGMFSVYLDLNISVYAPGSSTGTCSDDTFELNNNAAQAPLIQPGSYSGLSICDTQTSPIDEDWFAVQLTPGLEVITTITWNPSGQGLNVQLAQSTNGGVTYLAVGEGNAGQRTAKYVITETATYYVIVYGLEANKYSEAYDLSITLDNPSTQCIADTYEFGAGNNSAVNAYFLATNVGSTNLSGLSICPGDEDWFEFTGVCGQNATISISFDSDLVDLDLYLYESSNSTTPIDQSAGVLSNETVGLNPIHKTSTYLTKVKGFPSSAQGNYDLSLNITDGATCSDDFNEPNNGQAQATAISSGVPITNQKMCCNEDYYHAELSAGQSIEVTVHFQTGAGSVELISSSLNSTVATQSNTTVTVSWDATVNGTVFIRVYGAEINTTYSVGANYGAGGPSLCTELSCPQDQVCDPNTGCVSDFCWSHNDCPVGHMCTENYCINTCTNNNNCRTSMGYQCKTLMGSKYCAPAGSQSYGLACNSFTECSGASACLLLAYGGYCAVNNCWSDTDCPIGTSCFVQGEFSGYCALNCFINLDCREDEGYSCELISSFVDNNKWACVP